jgi:hypothetical protein
VASGKVKVEVVTVVGVVTVVVFEVELDEELPPPPPPQPTRNISRETTSNLAIIATGYIIHIQVSLVRSDN